MATKSYDIKNYMKSNQHGQVSFLNIYLPAITPNRKVTTSLSAGRTELSRVSFSLVKVDDHHRYLQLKKKGSSSLD